jgi:hypothetical protein
MIIGSVGLPDAFPIRSWGWSDHGGIIEIYLHGRIRYRRKIWQTEWIILYPQITNETLEKEKYTSLLIEKIDEFKLVLSVSRDELYLDNAKDIDIQRADLSEDVVDEGIQTDQPDEKWVEKFIFTGLYCLLNIGTVGCSFLSPFLWQITLRSLISLR